MFSGIGTQKTHRLAIHPYLNTALPGTSEPIRADLAIRNGNLDDWWVTHLRNGQVTDLKIEFYAVVDPAEDAVGGGLGGTGSFRIPLDPLDYRTTIETDMFGTKNGTATEGSASASDGDGRTSPTDTNGGTGSDDTSAGDDGDSTATTDGAGSDTEGGGLLG